MRETTSNALHHTRTEGHWLSVERIGSIVAGGALVSVGLLWQSSPKAAKIGALLGGGVLLYWGATGDSRLCRIMGMRGSQTKSGVASVHHNQAIRIEKTIIVDGPVERIYRIWRNPENLPCFVDHLRSVRAISDRRSHWIIKGPAGKDLEFESEVYYEKENETFSWRSLLNADLNNAGTVAFQSLPGSSKTELRVIFSYEPPGGVVGEWIARLFGSNPELQLEQDLAQFKKVFESGALTVH